jgi:hypothetical protein
VPVARHRTDLTMVDFPVSANVQPGYTSLVLSISPCHYLPEDVDSDVGEAERVVLLVARVKGSGRQHTRLRSADRSLDLNVANRPRFGGDSQALSWYRPAGKVQLDRDQLIARDRHSTERVFLCL